jgi:hypothetical protein
MMKRKFNSKRFLCVFILFITHVAVAQEKSFEERLKQASQQAQAAAEKAAESVTKKVTEQSAITAERVSITADNIRRAFEGQPLKPIYNDEYYRAVTVTKDNGGASDVANVVAIAPWNNDLIWLDAQKSRVAMVSFMPKWAVDRFYRPNLGKVFQTSTMPNVYIWATVVPQLKNFVQNYVKNPIPGVPLALRLKQYLGLPNSEDEYFFVELWVRPQDIFRPCVNTDIVGNVCIPDPNMQQMPATFRNIFDYVAHDPAYKKWFTDRKNTTYTGNAPFPWTRLGYTYDWGSKEQKKVGATEFVIKQGVPVLIISITPINDYLAAPLPRGN